MMSANVQMGGPRWCTSLRIRTPGVHLSRAFRSPLRLQCSSKSTGSTGVTVKSLAQSSQENIWSWRGHNISYTVTGSGSPLLLVHGFGTSGRQFRKNIPVLAQKYQVYTVDLLGFGGSDKALIDYSTELWRDLLQDFMLEKIKDPVVLIGNSLGSLAALMVSASSSSSSQVKGLVLLNCPIAMNNKGLLGRDWQMTLAFPLLLLLDVLLKIRPIANYLFGRLANKETLRNVLSGIYCNQESVDDELIDMIHGPSQDEGALDVFVSVYTGPPGLLSLSYFESVTCPLLVLWGVNDVLAPSTSVTADRLQKRAQEREDTQYFELQDVGHCLHDDRPEVVHEKLLPWLQSL